MMERQYTPITYINDDALILKANNLKTDFFNDSPFLQHFLALNQIHGTFSIESLTGMVFIDKLLYGFTGAVYRDYTPKNTIFHSRTILKYLTKARARGFVTIDDLYSNGLYNIFKEVIFSKALRDLNSPDPKLGYNLFELEHLNNLIYLHLIKNILLTRHQFQLHGGDIEIEDEKDEIFFDLEILRREIMGLLSPGLRSTITMNRILFERVFYTGFDTEYQTKDSGVNELLCVTTAHFGRAFVRIKTIHLDFSVTNKISKLGESQLLPSTSSDIRLLIYFIRYLNLQEDFALDKLQYSLEKDREEQFEVRSDGTGILICLPNKEWISGTKYLTQYFEPETLPDRDYSLKTLINLTKDALKDILNTDLEVLLKSINESPHNKLVKPLGEGKRRVKDIVYLLSHYSIADISL